MIADVKKQILKTNNEFVFWIMDDESNLDEFLQDIIEMRKLPKEERLIVLSKYIAKQHEEMILDWGQYFKRDWKK